MSRLPHEGLHFDLTHGIMSTHAGWITEFRTVA